MNASATVLHGDCLNALREMPDNSIGAIVTDPPYGLANIKPERITEAVVAWAQGDRERAPDGRGFMGHRWDAFVPPPAVWDECLRVLKPGGHLVAFAGSRTHDLMGLSIRLAGFEIRDGLAWLYGSGFPKSLDVSKAIDKAAGVELEAPPASGVGFMNAEGRGGYNVTKNQLSRVGDSTPEAQQWEGWGTALKPAFEPVTLARKPLDGTVAANVLKHGTGALNIDACRIEGEPWKAHDATGLGSVKFFTEGDVLTIHKEPHGGGRWPANVVLDESQAEALDQQSGNRPSRGGAAFDNPATVYGTSLGANQTDRREIGYGDEGGASRFFYCAKASSKERPEANGVKHPTVKPLNLMRWLVRLVTPPGGVVLDPFAGSGATLEAGILEGFDVIGVEREADYLPLIQQRLDRCEAEETPAGLVQVTLFE